MKFISNLLSIFSVLTSLLLVTACKKKEKEPYLPIEKGTIAYISTADHNYGEIYTCAMNGSGAKRISDLGAKNLSDSEYSPEFSPDGSKIKYRGFDFMIKVYDLNTQTNTTIAKAFDSDWSPDGKKIAYINLLDLDRQIRIANADGSNDKPLTNYNAYSDTSIFFSGLVWHSTEDIIITRAGYNAIPHLIKISPQNGKVTDMYPLNFHEYFTLRGNKITWANGDTVFFHDLISKNTTYFVTSGESPKNPVLSPDGSRVAYIYDRTYAYVNQNKDTVYRKVTDMISRNINGYDKRELTINNAIPDDTKYKSSFYPFWLSNTELLYSAGKIFKITDDVSPNVNAITDNLKAGGQLQVFKN